jgi:hypothetical protein
MEYTLARGITSDSLIDKVNELIKQGWKPQGGIVTCGEEVYTVYYQAMIKETSRSSNLI